MPQGGEPEWLVMLRTLTAHQTQELKAAVGSHGRRFEAIEKTIVANEKKHDERPPQAGAGAAAQHRQYVWWPRNVITGGWDSKTPRGVAVEDANKWITKYGQEVAHFILDPCTPRKYARIARVRCHTEDIDLASFNLQKLTKSRARSKEP